MKTKYMWRLSALAACAVVALVCLGGFRADEEKPAGGPLDRKDLDKIVHSTLRNVINHGADLYNPPIEDWNGCYRLYEGALMALRPLLDHRPELQKAIDTGVTAARSNPQLRQRAFDLRTVIDRIRREIEGKKEPSPPVAKKTLWDRLGGAKGVRKVVDDFVGAAADDKDVDFFRGKPVPPAAKVEALKVLLVDFVHEAAKDPEDKTVYYKGKTMKEAHEGMGITDKQFDALAKHLLNALEKNGVAPKDVDAVMGAVGGTRKDIVEKKPTDKKPEDKKPEDKKPEDKKPEDKKPGDKQPTDKKPEDKKPEDKKPTDKQPTDKKPEDKKPGDKQPTDKKPEDKKPTDSKPTDSKPGDK